MTPEERFLLEAIAEAEKRHAQTATADSRAYCRHGFPLPQERRSVRFTDADGIERWGVTWRDNPVATCPDQ